MEVTLATIATLTGILAGIIAIIGGLYKGVQWARGRHLFDRAFDWIKKNVFRRGDGITIHKLPPME